MELTPFVTKLVAALEADDLAPGTITRTRIDAAQFEEFLRGSTGSDLDPNDVQVATIDLQEFRGWLQRRDMTPGTIQRKFASIRKALLLLAPEVALKLKWPKLPTQQLQAPSELGRNLRNAILRAAESLSPRDECIIKMLLFTGARASTLAAARLSNVRLGERSGEITYHASSNKSNREYTVPLNSECRAAIRRYIAVRPEVEHDALLCSERFPFDPVTRGVVWTVWHERMRALLPKQMQDRVHGPHQARHDLCRRLTSGEIGPDGIRRPPVAISDAAAIMGHSDPRVTASVYSRPAPEDLKRALDELVGDEGEEV
jgi:integrase/recombinase XerC